MVKYQHAIVKWNGGNGALLCNKCRVIIRHGFGHDDTLHYCDKCKTERNTEEASRQA